MTLSPDEDADLRRLAEFARFGHLCGTGLRRFFDLRSRDRRRDVRPVGDLPVQLISARRLGEYPRGAECAVHPPGDLPEDLPVQRQESGVSWTVTGN